uniref:Uncharacterized protein n=1 Tax=Guillardia theta TaxID=55529 RepID=A0A7S4KNW3_GUITH|mmetsp:Transcript_28146/g.91243  ORF Transcript_28146/g.91243 Transcript_28146/m.91243 type:complete len:296 (+) Transcript_28146:111-998(+)
MSNDTASHDPQKELHAARKCALKYLKYHETVLKALMPVLLDKLAPEDRVKSRKLMRKLSTVVQWECSPDFSDEEARSGYIRRHFPHRSAQLGIILSHPDVVRLQQERSSEHELLVASLGGGPGCDVVGMVLHRNFTSQPRGLRVHVLDIEQGWRQANDVLLECLRACDVECRGDAVVFSSCDIVRPLSDGANFTLAQEMPALDIVLLSFVIAENLKAVRENEFAMFKDMFERVKPSCLILVLDCTHKFFEALQDLALSFGWQSRRIEWPKDINGHCKNVLAIYKDTPPPSLPCSE